MTVRLRNGAVGLLAAVAVAACQPELHSDLPRASAAYAAVAVPEKDAMEALMLLQARDEIGVNVFGEPDLGTKATVIDQSGMVSLPLIGSVQAAGLSADQLAKTVEQAYRDGYLRDPHVNVVLLKSAPRVVSVEGSVKDPGIYEVQQGYTLLDALAMAGSPLDTAKLSEVLIFRNRNGERLGGRFDLTDIRAGRSPDPAVLPGDVVVVGYSQVRGAYLDFIKAAPLVGAFSRY